jgi:undecaprenyl-diphosphatase
MAYLYQILLGAFQGLTEFLPVSSSGHLALIQNFFNQQTKEGLLIEIMAHFGSLLAIFFYYRKSISSALIGFLKSRHSENFNLYWITTLFVSTLPAGLAGLLLKDFIAPLFSNMNIVSLCFLTTSAVLLVGAKLSKQYDHQGADWPNHKQALIIGFSQAFALLPGISRSGATISTGIALGIKPKVAAFFSFCSVAPLIGAATFLAIFDLFSNTKSTNAFSVGELAALLLSSFFFGWIGLNLVIKFLESDKFHYFAFYLIPLACVTLFWGNFV